MTLNAPGAGSVPALALPSRFGQNAEQLFPSDKGLPILPGGMNMNTAWDGHFYPGFFGNALSAPAAFNQRTGSRHMQHIETIGPDGLARLYGNDGQLSVVYFSGNAYTVDHSFAAGIRGMAVGDDGTGNRALFVSFGASTAQYMSKRNLKTDTTPWTANTTSTYAQGYEMTRVGADLYMVSNFGAVSAETTYQQTEYHVSICPAGNDPTLAASWIGGWPCGTPEWPVMKLAPINGSVCAAKADGLWWYDDTAKRFINVLDFSRTPDPNNGLAMQAVQNGVLFPSADGRLFFFDGSASVEVTPFAGEDLPRDIYRNRITAICEWGGFIFCALDSYQQQMRPVDAGGTARVIVNINNAGATDVGSSVTSGDFSAAGGVAMSSWGQNAADFIDIWCDRPFEAAVLYNTSGTAQTSGQTFLAAYNDGSVFQPLTVMDGTQTAVTAGGLGTSTGSLSLTFVPPYKGDGVICAERLDMGAIMKKVTVSYGGAVGNISGYVWRLTPAVAATGMSTGARLSQVRVVPSRTGLPNGGIFANATLNPTAKDRAGCFTHIYAGRRTKTGGITWFDVHALNTLGGVTAMGFTQASVSGGQNGGPSLVVWGRYSTWAVYYGRDGDPFRVYKPLLARKTNTLAVAQSTTVSPIQPLVPTRFGRPLGKKKLTGAVVEGLYVDPAAQIDLYGSWDTGQDIFLIGTRYGVPAVFDVPATGFGTGRQLHTWVGIAPNTPGGQLPAPSLTGIWVLYDYVGEDEQFVTDPSLQIPETT